MISARRDGFFRRVSRVLRGVVNHDDPLADLDRTVERSNTAAEENAKMADQIARQTKDPLGELVDGLRRGPRARSKKKKKG